MARRRSTWLAWALWALVVCLCVLSFTSSLLQAGPSGVLLMDASDVVFTLALPLASVTVAALILSRRPRHAIGWLLMLPAVWIALFLPIESYIEAIAPSAPAPTLPLLLMVWASGWSWVVLIFPLLQVPLLFPDGQPPTPRWRWLVWATNLWALLLLLLITFSRRISSNTTPDLALDNPIGFLDQGVETFAGAWVVGLLILAVLCVTALFVRYRHAGVAQRKQIRWLMYSASVFLIVYVSGFGGLGQSRDLAGQIWQVLFSLSLLGFPAAIGVAILRYRLFDIDLIINRTLVYGTLTAIVAGLYSALVSLFFNIARDVSNQSSVLAIVLLTFVVTAAFTPVKDRLQKLVDNVFPAERDPAKELAAFRQQVEMLRQVVNPEQLNAKGLLQRLLSEAVDAFGADSGGVYLGQNGGRQLYHAVGEWAGEQGLSVPLESEGQEVGLVALGRRRNRVPYNKRDELELRQLVAVVSPLISRNGVRPV